MGVCILAGALHLAFATNAFTLAWTHSIEKVRWEEDYRVEAGVIVLESARIKGSAAGMEPPDDAVLRNGAWHYTPKLNRFPRLVLANSAFGGSYDFCVDGRCRALPFSTRDKNEPTHVMPCTSSGLPVLTVLDRQA